MPRRHLLPADMAAALRGVAAPRGLPFSFRRAPFGAAALAIETVGDVSTLAMVHAGHRSPIESAMATSMRMQMDHAGDGLALDLYVHDATGSPAILKAYLFDGGQAMVELHNVEGGDASPPGWLAGLPVLLHADTYQVPWAEPAPAPPSDALAALSALLSPEAQRGIALEAFVAFGEALPEIDRWDAIDDASRSLGMELSVDKALVRTALAPFASGIDARVLLDGLAEGHARIQRDHGAYVLVERETGAVLGSGGVQAPGTVTLRPGAAPPALLTGADALALCSSGRVELPGLALVIEDPAGTVPLPVGVTPSELIPVARVR